MGEARNYRHRALVGIAHHNNTTTTTKGHTMKMTETGARAGEDYWASDLNWEPESVPALRLDDVYNDEPFDAEAEEWAAHALVGHTLIYPKVDEPTDWLKVYRFQDAARYRVFRNNGVLNVGSMTFMAYGAAAWAVCRYCGQTVSMAQCLKQTKDDVTNAEELLTALVLGHGYSEMSRFLARDGKISGVIDIDTTAIWNNYRA